MGRGKKHGKRSAQNNVNLLEGLESRRMLSSASLSGGVLKVIGNSSSDNALHVRVSGSNFVASHNGASKSYSASSVNRIEIVGGSQDDSIWVSQSITKTSVIRGNGGDDTLCGGSGKDSIYGGDGNDEILGYAGDDYLRGEDGQDTLTGHTGKDYLDGGSGNDVRYDEQFSGGVTSDTGSIAAPDTQPLNPTPTSSTVSLSNGVLKVAGLSSGNNVAVTASGSNIVVNHNGATKSYSSSSVSRIEIAGGSAADNISISSAITKSSVIRGNSGNDTLSGGSGKDSIYGGAGNDKISGNSGDDALRGEDGEDTLYGGSGRDYVDGGNGNDIRYDEQFSGGVTSDVPLTSTPPTSGGNDNGGSIPQNNSGDAPTAVITTRGSSIQAGHAVFVHGLSSSLRDGNPNTARYEWDFGDSGSKYNKLVGFNAAHAYDDPGTYTVKLTVWNESGRSDTATTTIRVASSTRRKIYVSSSGSDSNSGSSSSPVKTLGKAASMLRDNTEILFRRGDTFTTNFGIDANGYDNVLIGAYGSGNRPVLKFTGPRGWYALVSNDRDGTDLTVQDVTLDSHFTTGTSSSEIPVGVKPSGDNTLVRNVEFRNLGYAIQGNALPDGLLVQDSTSPSTTQLRGYFSWAQGSDHVYLGNYVANVRSHVIRTEGMTRINISHNNFSNPPEEGVVRGTLTIHKGSYAYVANNTLQSGAVAIGPLGESQGLSDKSARWTWGVFESNVIKSGFDIVHGASRIMLRNNVIERDGDYAIKVDGWNSEFDRGVSDLTVVNNTVTNDSTRGNFIKYEGEAPGSILANNLYDAPRLVTGSWGTAPVSVRDRDLNGFDFIGNNVWADADPIYFAQGGMNYVWPDLGVAQGYKTPSEWNGYGEVGTDYFSDVSVSSSYAPSSSSLAANAGRAFAGVFTDRNGKIRPSSGATTAGAVEV